VPHSLFPTPFGTCAVAWNDSAITRFRLPEATETQTARLLADDGDKGVAEEDAPEWVRLVIALARRHLGGDMQDFSAVALEPTLASEFEFAVYRQTQLIRPGFKGTYGEIAVALGLGAPAARAVGVALGANPWPLLVPCHRVVSADGKMTGFSAPGGIRTKTRLLTIEGAELLSE
jgi:methylated-DNA-[protein]-cysteine S-methyltransferase